MFLFHFLAVLIVYLEIEELILYVHDVLCNLQLAFENVGVGIPTSAEVRVPNFRRFFSMLEG